MNILLACLKMSGSVQNCEPIDNSAGICLSLHNFFNVITDNDQIPCSKEINNLYKYLICRVKFYKTIFLHYISYFIKKAGFDISCKSFSKGTFYMKCHSLPSGKNKKNIIVMS